MTVHPCCGCSCSVCKNGHDMSETKVHTEECRRRFFEEVGATVDEGS